MPGDGAARVQTVLVERLYQLATQLFAVLCLSFQQARASHLLLVQQQQVVVAVARSLPHVLAIHSQLSPDGQMTLVILGLDEDSDAAVADVPLLQVWLEAVPGPIHLHLTSEAAGATVLQQVTQADTTRIEALVLPLTLAALLLVFGGLVASLLPPELAGLTLTTTLALLALGVAFSSPESGERHWSRTGC